VYEAFDREWNVPVAVKTLLALKPEHLLRLKNEFRAIEEIRHPNLVRLGELLVENGQWLFTMELVDGVDFVRWVRQDGAADLQRLRDGLRQLAQALRALHQSGRVHRDVKPSNVLVTREPRVVLLDFGLITRVAADDAMTDGLVVGTPEYMAPEQAAGLPVTPAADWYSVGVLLHEALTGRLPDGRAALYGAPADLARLCAGLLERDPDRRSGFVEVAAALGVAVVVEPDGHEAPFVGREAELARLDRAFGDARAGANTTVFVTGGSGIGKSTLVQRFARGLLERSDDVLILSSHASDRELVPFNGFDGIVDGLMRHLAELPDGERGQLLDGGADALAALFPVLSRLPGVTRAADDEPAAARRKRAFAQLRRLLATLARRRPLVLLIDDFHNSDDDTLALRRAVMSSGGRPGWLLVATVRTDGAARDFLRKAVLSTEEHPDEVRELELQPLSDAESTELVHELGARVDVSAAHGHPLFLAELARAGRELAGDLCDTIRARVDALSPAARTLLDVLAVAGTPLRPPVAAAAAELGAETWARAADEARAARLLRSAGSGLRAGVEPYHAEIRRALLERIPPQRLRALHASLAHAIERAPLAAEPRTLFLHWLGAGDRDRAARAAEDAAVQADAQLAFDLAAGYYARAIDLSSDRARRPWLMARRARALANAGRKREAVAAYREAAAIELGPARLDLLRSAAEVLLHNGDIDEGAALLRTVLDGVGMRWPAGAPGSVLSLVLHRLLIRVRGLGWTERPEAELPAPVLARIDTAWSAAMALSLVDRARGADFQARGLLLALEAGEPFRVARALLLESVFSCMGGSRTRARTHEVLDDGRHLAERSGRADALALFAAAEGVALAMEGDFRAGAARIETARPLLRAHASRWNLLDAEYILLMVRTLLGELRQVRERVGELEAEAVAGDDLALRVNLHTGYPPIAQLALDDPRGARDAVDEVMRRWSQRGFHRQHWSALFARSNCDLYEGQGETVWRNLEAAWPSVRRSLLLRSQPVRVAALNLRARAALATGRTGAALRDAHALEREEVGWATGFAALIRAGASPSRDAFARAADLLSADGLALHAAVARRQAGIDDPWWREQAVANPDGFVRCFSPGGGP
jgi:hypothetical protein